MAELSGSGTKVHCTPMLFNSYEFILVFLPLVWSGYHLLARSGASQIAVWGLVLASLMFYGYWNIYWVPILVGSLVINYSIAGCLSPRSDGRHSSRRLLLIVGIACNLLLLGYFKYTNFLVDNLNALTDLGLTIERILLPIGISFFTFQQIAFLVDQYRGVAGSYDFRRYALFVTFFPQLIAGPIVHYKEMIPQFARLDRGDLAGRLAVGLTIFTIGLFKKVIIADNAAIYADHLFAQASIGMGASFLECWVGVFAYGFQIYFDFSGYSDMAIGLAWMFGIRLPINFASPYKATSITDFWRRWHITLSRFLRDYLYVSLGGNRRGRVRQYVNIFLTMLLGGFWHGAGWTFLLWGAMHGAFLIVNRLWRAWRGSSAAARHVWPSRLLTFFCVMIAWVPFRAPDFAATFEVYGGMLGLNGVILPEEVAGFVALAPGFFAHLGIEVGELAFTEGGRRSHLWLIPVFVIIWALPNTHEWMARSSAGLPVKGYPATEPADRTPHLAWRPNLTHGAAVAMMAFVSIVVITDEAPFIYFQF